MSQCDIDEIMRSKRPTIVKCATDDECVHVTQLMLDIGAEHGRSGWSKRISCHDFGGKPHWRHPRVMRSSDGLHVEIEYYSERADLVRVCNNINGVIITYDEFVSMCEKDSTEYEISDDEMNDIFNFLHNA